MLSILFLFSCTEPFEIKTNDSESVIVIYGVITDEYKHQSVRVTHSSPYFNPLSDPSVSDAIVTISFEDQIIELFEDPDSAGIYTSNHKWKALPDTHYILNVDVDFDKDGVIDNYQASTIFKQEVYLDSIHIRPITIMGHLNYALNVYGQDSPDEDYYLFHVSVNDSIVVNEKLTKSILSDDKILSGQYINGLTISYMDDISEWETDSEETRENSTYLKKGDRIKTGISSIPKGYFDFLNQCISEKNGENPLFGGPASNITTNISNGGVGYFAGYCITYTSTVVQ